MQIPSDGNPKAEIDLTRQICIGIPIPMAFDLRTIIHMSACTSRIVNVEAHWTILGDCSEGQAVDTSTTILPPTSSWAEPIRILCVDDNRDLADSEALLLQLLGFEALACYDGFSAMRAVTTFHPCVCLIDFNMPKMNGSVLAERLCADSEHRPRMLIAVTARDDQESCLRIKSAGFDLQLVKPVDANYLIEVIDGMREKCRPAGPPAL
jgi:two-component system, OmpR family, response regulator